MFEDAKSFNTIKESSDNFCIMPKIKQNTSWTSYYRLDQNSKPSVKAQMIKCFSVICNYCSNFYYEKLSGTGLRKKVVCFSITRQLLRSHYLYSVLKATLITYKIGCIFKILFCYFWKLKLLNMITEIDLITPLFKERTYELVLILSHLSWLWNNKQLQRYKIFWVPQCKHVTPQI